MEDIVTSRQRDIKTNELYIYILIPVKHILLGETSYNALNEKSR